MKFLPRLHIVVTIVVILALLGPIVLAAHMNKTTTAPIASPLTTPSPTSSANADSERVPSKPEGQVEEQPPFTATINGRVYVDQNNNSVKDAYESGLTGKDVTAYEINSSGAFKTTTAITNDDGYFTLKLAKLGTYQIQLGDLNLAYQYPPHPRATITKSNETKSADIRLIPLSVQHPEPGPNTGIIQGITFNDTNNNGTKDDGESGTDFFKLNLYNSANTQVASTTSDSNGSFTYSNLPLDTYRIEAYNPSDQYTITKGTATVTLTADHTLDNTATLGVIKNF